MEGGKKGQHRLGFVASSAWGGSSSNTVNKASKRKPLGEKSTIKTVSQAAVKGRAIYLHLIVDPLKSFVKESLSRISCRVVY